MAVVDDLIQHRARAALEVIERRARVRAAYLFGSQVGGSADRDSDVDIAVFIDDASEWDLPRRVRASVEAQEQVGDDIEIHFFPAESLEQPPAGSFASHILRHGVRIL